MVAKKPAPASEYYNLAFTHDNYTKITSCGMYLIRKGYHFNFSLEFLSLLPSCCLHKCSVHPIFGFWFLVTSGDEVMKIQKY